MARKRQKSSAAELLVVGSSTLILVSFIFYSYAIRLYFKVKSSFGSQQLKYIFVTIIILFSILLLFKLQKVLRKIKQHFLLQRQISELMPSTLRENYQILNEDYKRGNKRENSYRKLLLLKLLNLFDNRCAKCGNDENGIEIDHFLFSKNEGGSFVMLHKDNYLVNNAIPLCQSCNRKKADKKYDLFFSHSELKAILFKNQLLTQWINAEFKLGRAHELLRRRPN